MTTAPEVRALARRIAGTEAATRQRGEQLAYSALEDGAIREFSLEGDQTAQYGKQYDGTSTAAVLISPPPPAPSTPLVSAVAGGLVVTWDGTFENDIAIVAPMDWRQTDLVVGPVGMDPIATPPSVGITSPRGGENFIPLPAGTYDVALVSRTLAGRPSAPSASVQGTALPLVDSAVFDEALVDLGDARTRLTVAEQDVIDALADALTASNAAATAQGDATTALANAAAANALAVLAQAKANAAITVYRQSSAPATGLETNDLWIDSDDGLLYVWTGSWTLSADQRVATVVASNATKTTVFAQISQPATSGRTIGDIWIDTDDGNKIYDWSGSWTVRLLGAAAISATARQLGSTTVYRQSTAPASGMITNDLWIDSDDGLVYVYTGTWTLSADQRIAAVVASDAVKITMFFQTSAPSSVGRILNDLWIDTDDNQKVYRWTGSAWALTDIANVSYIASRGTDLVTNGTGLLGNNTNWSSWTVSSDAPEGISRSFVAPSGLNRTDQTDELVPLNPSKRYVISNYTKNMGTAPSKWYGRVWFYDTAGLLMSRQHNCIRAGSEATLALPLNPGDLTMKIAGGIQSWQDSVTVNDFYFFRYINFYDYVDPNGKLGNAYEFTRNNYMPFYGAAQMNYTAVAADGTVTLGQAYNGPARAAGVPVAIGRGGDTSTYSWASALDVPTTWTKFSGLVAGVQTARTGAVGGEIPFGTGYCKPVFLHHYMAGTDIPNHTFAVAGMSISDASAAQVSADAANALATLAKSTADSKITVFRQASAPAAGPVGTYKINGDLWIDSDDGMVYYTSTSTGTWLASPDQRIGTVVTSNATKTTVFAQISQPSTSGRTIGDIWIDTDDGNKIYDWSGSWTVRLIGAGAISATARQLGAVNIYRQSTAPASGMVANDMWVDSDDGLLYIFTTVWALSADQRIAAVVASDAVKITLFSQTSPPATTGRVTGDLWIDLDDGNKMYVWNGSAWSVRILGDSALASLDLSKLVVVGGANVNDLVAQTLSAQIANFIQINANNINVGALDGKTINGALIRTAAAGERWELTGVGALKGLRGYSGLADETAPAGMETTVTGLGLTGGSGTVGALRLFAPERSSDAYAGKSELALSSGGTEILAGGGAGGYSMPTARLASKSIKIGARSNIYLGLNNGLGEDSDYTKGMAGVSLYTDMTDGGGRQTAEVDMSATEGNATNATGLVAVMPRKVGVYAGTPNAAEASIEVDQAAGVTMVGDVTIGGVTVGQEPYSYKTPGAVATFPNNAWTKTTAWADNGGTVGVTFAADRWTVVTPGRYDLKATLSYFQHATGIRAVGIRVNGTSIRDIVTNATSSSQCSVTNTMEYRFAAGDYIEIWGYQNSGTTATKVLDGTTYSGFSMRYIGS